jgi:hypothetical protein
MRRPDDLESILLRDLRLQASKLQIQEIVGCSRRLWEVVAPGLEDEPVVFDAAAHGLGPGVLIRMVAYVGGHQDPLRIPPGRQHDHRLALIGHRSPPR